MGETKKTWNELKDKNIVFMGTPEFSVPTLRALHEHANVIAVVTQMDSRSGRGKAYKPTAVKEAALEMGLEVYQFEKVNSQEAKDFLSSLKIDFIIVVAYGQILKKWLIDLPKYDILNVHASLLPKLRGAAPMQRAILEDFKETGVTIMRIDEGLDTGDMFAKVSIPIKDDMDFGALHDVMKDLGTDALLDTMAKIVDKTAIPTVQNSEESTYAAMIKKSEARVDWNESGRVIFNKIRGLSPFLGAYSMMGNKRFKFWKSRFLSSQNEAYQTIFGDEAMNLENGDILIKHKSELFVKVGDGLLEILEIQPENSKKMSIGEFLRGYQVKNGKFE